MAVADPSTRSAELVRRLKAGEEAAFEELVRMYTGRLIAVAGRITRTEADAEDAVQEAFLSVFKSIEFFDDRSELGTWMHRVTVNAALMRLRQQKSRPEMSIDALLPQFEGGMHREHPRPWLPVTDEGDARIEQKEALRKAIDQLPEEFRTVLLLRDIEGLESRAVATSLGVSDALVRQRLHRGRQVLMKLLEPMMTPAPGPLMSTPDPQPAPQPCPQAARTVTCPECVDFLMDYLDGVLPADQRFKFESHLAFCPDCATYMQNYRSAAALTRKVGEAERRRPGDQVPAGLAEVILEARKQGR